MKASANPNWPVPSEVCSWTHGTRVANEPVTAPCTANTAATAYRARLTSPRALLTSLMSQSLPKGAQPALPATRLSRGAAFRPSRHEALPAARKLSGTLPDR
ncbi:hypothetical protein GCM10017687_56860 [Streptomyces echinatus]